MAAPTELDPKLHPGIELARRRLLPFICWVMPTYEIAPIHVLVAEEFERFIRDVEARRSPRLIINVPFRVGKSEIVSRKGPPFILGNHPDWSIGLVSYGAELAEELSGDARRCVMSDEYAELFGAGSPVETEDVVELDPSSKSVAYWRVKGRRGNVRAVGVGGALTGRGLDIGIVDDPTKGRKEADSRGYLEEQWAFYKGTFYSRIEPGGGILIMATRWATNDMPGRLIEEMGLADDEDVDRWRVISIPAECETGVFDPLGRQPGEFMAGRFSPDQWRRIKANMPEREWLAQAQQRPVPAEGAIFHPYQDFVFAPAPTEPDGSEYVGPRFAFADTSYARNRQGDYSVITVWQLEQDRSWRDGEPKKPTLGLLDVYRGRYQFPELKGLAERVYARYGLWSLTIEDYGSGTSLAQEFKRATTMRIGTWRPDRDKVSRAHSATDIMASYNVRIPATEGAMSAFPSGLAVHTYLEELANFQGMNDAHDDMVDATTMAMILIGVKDIRNRRKMGTASFAFVGD